MKYSTVPAEFLLARRVKASNWSLQCGFMRIELPSASWADTLLRAEDDAHTLTVAAQPTPDWFGGWMAEVGATLRTEVTAAEPPTATLTF